MAFSLSVWQSKSGDWRYGLDNYWDNRNADPASTPFTLAGSGFPSAKDAVKGLKSRTTIFPPSCTVYSYIAQYNNEIAYLESRILLTVRNSDKHVHANDHNIPEDEG